MRQTHWEIPHRGASWFGGVVGLPAYVWYSQVFSPSCCWRCFWMWVWADTNGNSASEGSFLGRGGVGERCEDGADYILRMWESAGLSSPYQWQWRPRPLWNSLTMRNPQAILQLLASALLVSGWIVPSRSPVALATVPDASAQLLTPSSGPTAWRHPSILEDRDWPGWACVLRLIL